MIILNSILYRNFKRSISCTRSINVVQRKSWRTIPGPSTLPIIGQLHHFLPGGSLFNKQGYVLFDHLFKTYGPIVRLNAVLKPDVVFLFDAENTAKIYRGENWNPIRLGFFALEYYRRYHKKPKEHASKPTGLVTDQEERWRQFRTKVNPAMMLPKVIKIYNKVIDEVAIDTIGRWRYLRDKNNRIPGQFDREMSLWSLESVGVVALGTRINCLDVNLSKNPRVSRLIECTREFIKISDELDYKPSLWRYYPTKTFKKAMKVYEDIESITKYYAQEATKIYENKGNSIEGEVSILEKLLQIDEEIALIMSSDMLVAGIDTISNTTLGVLYLLATNRDKQLKLRESLRKPEQGKVYLKACIKESMRMMPVVGLNIRQATKEYNIMGYVIPKGLNVIFCHEYMSMMDVHFPNPKQYIPERWIVDENDPMYYGNAHPFAYMPFGFGARTCIGRRIVELNMETFLTRLIENFDIDWVGPPPQINSNHINYIKGPYNFIFKDI